VTPTIDDLLGLLTQATVMAKGLQTSEGAEPGEPTGAPPEISGPGPGGATPLPPPALGGAPAGAVPTAQKPPAKKPNFIPGQMDSRKY
jgi:hypothetical protein